MTCKQKFTLWRILLSAISCVAAFFMPLDQTWRIIAFIIPYLIIGYDVLWDAVLGIVHGSIFDEKFLMTVATIGAFAVGEYPEAAGVMLFYQIGELFQSVAVGKSRKSIVELMDIRPDTACVLRNGEEYAVSPEEVTIGETLIIRPGEKVPVDGEITEGSTSVNMAALTGESLPVDKTCGDKIISGSINLTGVIHAKADSLYENSTVAKILELMENSSAKKARAENFITRFARYYTPMVVIAAVLIGVIPPIVFSQSWSIWLNRALIFLMVSCPCALVVSVPLSFFSGIGRASRAGILIKGANYMEALSKIDTVVFDKTGTLTRGRFKVDAIHPDSMEEAELLDIAAAAESFSTHPVAESIVEAHGGHIDRRRIGTVTEAAGKGVIAEIDGKLCYVGNTALMDEAHAKWQDCELVGTVIHISEKDDYMGHIIVNDEIKPDSREAIKRIKDLGVNQAIMLTGDTERIAESVAEKLGIDKCYAQLLPAQKVEAIEALIHEGHKAAFLGDGINDAPALSRADVGIAMGAMGSDAAIEAADIVIMDDNLLKLPEAIRISKQTMRIVKQNIVFALGVKLIILVLTAIGLTNMWIAVFGDVGVMILAILNSMRIMINKK